MYLLRFDNLYAYKCTVGLNINYNPMEISTNRFRASYMTKNDYSSK